MKNAEEFEIGCSLLGLDKRKLYENLTTIISVVNRAGAGRHSVATKNYTTDQANGVLISLTKISIFPDFFHYKETSFENKMKTTPVKNVKKASLKKLNY